MKTKHHPPSSRHSRGFTLIEMIAVVGILAAVIAILISPIQRAMQRSRVTSATGTVSAVTNAVTDYLTKAGSSGVIPITEGGGGGTIPNNVPGGPSATVLAAAATLDKVLLSEGVLEKPISVKLGLQNNKVTGTIDLTWDAATQKFSATGAPDYDYSTITRLECRIANVASAPSASAGANFFLDGTNPVTSNGRIAYLVMPSVAADDAYQLALTIDGHANTASPGAAQNAGAVVFAAPVGGVTDVYYYIAKQ